MMIWSLEVGYAIASEQASIRRIRVVLGRTELLTKAKVFAARYSLKAVD